MNKAIIAVVLVIAVALGSYFLLNRDSNSSNSQNQPQTQTQTPSSTSLEVTITYSDQGFSPSSVSVKSGGKVTIKNTSTNDLQFSSDPHPVHTNNTELNQANLTPGKMQTFTVTTKGTFGYHNHLNPNDKGSITVE